MLTALTALVFFLLALNLIAAGFVAIAHVWRPAWSHQRRVTCAAIASGAMPLAMAAGALLPDALSSGSDLLVSSFGLAVILAIGGAVSLPLALVISRKLGVIKYVGDTFS